MKIFGRCIVQLAEKLLGVGNFLADIFANTFMVRHRPHFAQALSQTAKMAHFGAFLAIFGAKRGEKRGFRPDSYVDFARKIDTGLRFYS